MRLFFNFFILFLISSFGISQNPRRGHIILQNSIYFGSSFYSDIINCVREIRAFQINPGNGIERLIIRVFLPFEDVPIYVGLNTRNDAYLYLLEIYDDYNSEPVRSYDPSDPSDNEEIRYYNGYLPSISASDLNRETLLNNLRSSITDIRRPALHSLALSIVESLRTNSIALEVQNALNAGRSIDFSLYNSAIRNWKDFCEAAGKLIRSALHCQNPSQNFNNTHEIFNLLTLHAQGAIDNYNPNLGITILIVIYNFLNNHNANGGPGACLPRILKNTQGCEQEKYNFSTGCVYSEQNDIIDTKQDISIKECEKNCEMNDKCTFFTWEKGLCLLRSGRVKRMKLIENNLSETIIGFRKVIFYNKISYIEILERPYKQSPNQINCDQHCTEDENCIGSIKTENECKFFNQSISKFKKNPESKTTFNYFPNIVSLILKTLVPVTRKNLKIHTELRKRYITLSNDNDCWNECLKNKYCIGEQIIGNQCYLYNKLTKYGRVANFESYMFPDLTLPPKINKHVGFNEHFNHTPGVKEVQACWDKCLENPQCVASHIFKDTCWLYNKLTKYQRVSNFKSYMFPDLTLPPKINKNLGFNEDFANHPGVNDPQACWDKCLENTSCVASHIFKDTCWLYNKLTKYGRVANFESYMFPDQILYPKIETELEFFREFDITGDYEPLKCWEKCLNKKDCIAAKILGNICFLYDKYFYLRNPVRNFQTLMFPSDEFPPFIVKSYFMLIYDNIWTRPDINNGGDCWKLCLSTSSCVASMVYNLEPIGLRCFLYKTFSTETLYPPKPLPSYPAIFEIFVMPAEPLFIRGARLYGDFLRDSNIRNDQDCWKLCLKTKSCVASMVYDGNFVYGCLLYDHLSSHNLIYGSSYNVYILTKTYFQHWGVRLYNHFHVTPNIEHHYLCWMVCLQFNSCIASMIFGNNCYLYTFGFSYVKTNSNVHISYIMTAYMRLDQHKKY